MSSIADIATGGVEVVISRYLPKDEVRMGPDGRVHAGSMEAVERMVVEANALGYVIRTSPPCWVNRETGEIVELPEPPAKASTRPVCRVCGVRHG